MGNEICILIVLCCQDELIRVILVVDAGLLPEDCCRYYMEPENKTFLYNLLPEYIRDMGGKIVYVSDSEIFDVVIKN